MASLENMGDVAKAGWLYRLSSVLHRWKKNWFVLRTTGDLLYFEGPDNPRAEDRIVVRAVVTRIKPSYECSGVSVPEGMPKGSLFALEMRGGDVMNLCAESTDDMRAWQIALEEARVMSHGPLTTYQTVYTPRSTCTYPRQVYGYPGQVIYPPQTQVIYPGQQVVYQGAGSPYVYNGRNPNVVYVDRGRRYDGTDVAMGVVAGAALGSMMWGPLWW